MSGTLPKIFLSSLVSLSLGVAVGRYALSTPKADSAVKPSEERVQVQPEASSPATPAPVAIEPPVPPASSPEAVATLEKENELLKTKVVELEKSLNTMKESEKLAPIYDSEESRAKLVDEMLEITEMKKQIEDGFVVAADMMLKDVQDPEKRKAGAELIKKHYSWEKFSPEIIKIYTKVYSADDLQRINKFYKTDSGQMMLDKTPELMSELMKTVQKINEDAAPKLMPELMKLIDKKGEEKKAPEPLPQG